MGSMNLPVALTSFIGRERELSEVRKLLVTSRLVTLTGPGGCGKTRLAIQAASEIKDTFRDGVWLADLASVREPGYVPGVIAQALGVRLAPDAGFVEQLQKWVENRNMLLVMDNCEYQIEACAQIAARLLSHSPEIRILATSREPLATPGESILPLAGLDYPAPNLAFSEWSRDPDQYDAVRLLVERVCSTNPHFTITLENGPDIAEICRRLDGLPLALELASARANIFTIRQIAARLGDRFNLLVSNQRGDPDARHHTLRAAIDWSHDLLTTAEQVLFRRLAVFNNGFSMATAEAVCTGDGIEIKQVLELLSSLVTKSLVVANTLQRSEAHYSLLETIRQYAQEKLAVSGEWPALRDRHLDIFLRLMEDTAQKLTGPYQQLWLDWLAGENDNIRAAMSWSLESGRIEPGLRIAIAIYQFWTVRDHVIEGLEWMERLLAKAGDEIPPVVRANALAYAAFLSGFRGNIQTQMKYGQEAAVLAESASEQGRSALKWALSAQAYGARAAGDYLTELALEERVIQLNRELGDTYQLGVTLSVSSSSAMALGRYDTARAMLEEGLILLRQAGNPYRIAMTLNFSGDLSRCLLNYKRAQGEYEEAIKILREIGAVRDLASALHNLGHACLRLGETGRARALFTESISAQVGLDNRPGIAEDLIGFAGLAVVCGLPGAGARLLAFAMEYGGQHIIKAWAATQLEYNHYLAWTQDALGETKFQAEQAVGRKFSITQAVEYAQNLPLKTAGGQPTREPLQELTAREREVAAMISQGMANSEIAARLVVSKRTIEKHIAHIISKLGVSNRAQIVRRGIETGLVKLG